MLRADKVNLYKIVDIYKVLLTTKPLLWIWCKEIYVFLFQFSIYKIVYNCFKQMLQLRIELSIRKILQYYKAES